MNISSEREIRKTETGVGGCLLYRLPHVIDVRGSISVTEFEKDLPFTVKRCFWVFDVPSREIRGEHAHKECHQFLVSLVGQVTIVIDDGSDRIEINLDSPSLGLYLPPRVWGAQSNFSKETVLLVLASHPYDPADYIRDYDQFLKIIGKCKI